jgi:hypothetical protein
MYLAKYYVTVFHVKEKHVKKWSQQVKAMTPHIAKAINELQHVIHPTNIRNR